jgi:transcriptional regulator with XRE-family HTH domain
MVQGRRPNPEQRRRLAELRARGLSYAEIGRRLGVSKQAVHLALRKLGRPPPSVPCARCGTPIVSAGALAGDRGTALCLACLERTPGAPFGRRLQALRLAAGLTQTQLNRRAGLARGTVWRYERYGHTPRSRNLARLARVLPGLVAGAGPAAEE